MLGWSFSISDDKGISWAYWTGGLASDEWLQNGLKENKAEVVLKTGGYPDLYKVKPEIIPTEKYSVIPDDGWLYLEVWDQS